MRNLLLMIAAIAMLASTVGCANGPLRQWLRGAPCDTCNPQFNTPQFSHSTGGCADGTCSSGLGLSGGGSNVFGTAPTGNGLLGGAFGSANRGPIFNTPTATAPPASIPASALTQDSTFGGSPEIYGSTTSAGRIELPPVGPFN